MLDEIESKLKEFGVDPEQIGKAVIIYLLAGVVWTLILWALCYIFNPTRTFLSKIPLKWVQNRLYQSQPISMNSWGLRYIPEKFKGKGFLALLEMFIVKPIFSPISIPLRVWVTLAFIIE